MIKQILKKIIKNKKTLNGETINAIKKLNMQSTNLNFLEYVNTDEI